MTAGTRAFVAWLEASGLRWPDVAAQLGISLNTVYNLRYGQRPSLRVAVAIAKLSEGAVSVESWEQP
jgi:hypothetical protein